MSWLRDSSDTRRSDMMWNEVAERLGGDQVQSADDVYLKGKPPVWFSAASWQLMSRGIVKTLHEYKDARNYNERKFRLDIWAAVEDEMEYASELCLAAHS